MSSKGICAYIICINRWLANGLLLVPISRKERAFYPIRSVGISTKRRPLANHLHKYAHIPFNVRPSCTHLIPALEFLGNTRLKNFRDKLLSYVRIKYVEEVPLYSTVLFIIHFLSNSIEFNHIVPENFLDIRELSNLFKNFIAQTAYNIAKNKLIILVLNVFNSDFRNRISNY